MVEIGAAVLAVLITPAHGLLMLSLASTVVFIMTATGEAAFSGVWWWQAVHKTSSRVVFAITVASLTSALQVLPAAARSAINVCAAGGSLLLFLQVLSDTPGRTSFRPDLNAALAARLSQHACNWAGPGPIRCCICLDDLAGCVSHLACTHSFHEACLTRWVTQGVLHTSLLCPMCRAPINPCVGQHAPLRQ